MIQRLQSVFLFLVAVAMGLTLGLDLWVQVVADSGEIWKLNALFMNQVDASGEILQSSSNWYIAALASFAGLLAIISIFQYRNLGRQMMINMVNSLLMVALVAIIFLTTNGVNTEMAAADNGEYQIGFWAILAAMVCNMLANRFIRKDVALLKSVDRIR
jgi:glucan phosphoethanolaminetransferase (alkaline phosphatase superfamily)